MDNLIERVSALEQKVENLNTRLQLEECRWIPKVEVVLVWFRSGNTPQSYETLLGVFSTKDIADVYITNSTEKMKYGTLRAETVAMDTCLAPVVQ